MAPAMPPPALQMAGYWGNPYVPQRRMPGYRRMRASKHSMLWQLYKCTWHVFVSVSKGNHRQCTGSKWLRTTASSG
ncbi:unnamed protein product [Urochloa humidicola]